MITKWFLVNMTLEKPLTTLGENQSESFSFIFWKMPFTVKQEKLRKNSSNQFTDLSRFPCLHTAPEIVPNHQQQKTKNLQHLRTALNVVRPPREACWNSRTLLYGLYRFCIATSLEIRAKKQSCSCCPLPRFLCWKWQPPSSLKNMPDFCALECVLAAVPSSSIYVPPHLETLPLLCCTDFLPRYVCQ